METLKTISKPDAAPQTEMSKLRDKVASALDEVLQASKVGRFDRHDSGLYGEGMVQSLAICSILR